MEVDADSRARTHLANERTFLAWFRTGITLVALGIAAAQFLAPATPPGETMVRGISLVVIVTGAFVIGMGFRRYQDGRQRIDAAAFRPAGTSILVASAAGVATAILATLFVLLITRG